MTPLVSVPRQRLPRYRRASSPPPMQLTARDVRVLNTVSDMRFLTREQVQELLFSPSTASYCKRRLALLYHNAYLDRVYVPSLNAFGATKAIYTLATKGAAVVARDRKIELRELMWRPGHNDRELYFMRHTLAINDFRIRLALAARQRGLSLAWTDERALRRREMKDYIEDPEHRGRRLAIVPDGYFTLDDGERTSAFALEIDRATVEEKPFKEKVRGYGEWKTTGTYERRYGTKSLRVLWVVADVTRDSTRLERIKRWTEAEGGRSLFWFSMLDDLTPETILTEPVWLKAGSEERHSLL
ncbi:MAG TPA: replication-relaxation family protein [Thermoleophilia bacterium]|nr:replication-relaxation family protein [Thermoleophilia bacterium]